MKEMRNSDCGMRNENNQNRKFMAYEALKNRTKKFALDVINLVEMLPNDQVGKILGGQLLRAGTSVGANYRSACRGRSNADFISKMGIVEEEADETGYWLDLLISAGKVSQEGRAVYLVTTAAV